MTIQEQEAKIHESQHVLIAQRFNTKVALAAHYSLRTSFKGDLLTLTTKVYWTRRELPVKDRTKRWYKYLPQPSYLESAMQPNGSIIHRWGEEKR
jgi:hypothetical protein